MKRLKKANKQGLHPLMTYFLLILGTIVLSGFLKILDTQATFYKINKTNEDYGQYLLVQFADLKFLTAILQHPLKQALLQQEVYYR